MGYRIAPAMQKEMDVPKIVTSEWLKQELEKPEMERESNLKIVDATWHSPVWKRDAGAEHESCRIKGAVFMDIREIRDTESKWPMTLPTKEQFENCISKLGISNDSAIVLYDNNDMFGLYSAARSWLIFKLFGHKKISIVDGGLPKYLKTGGPTESGPPPSPEAAVYKVESINSNYVRSYEQMLLNWKEKSEQVVDGRPAGQFNGTSPDLNPNLHSGHMIGANNIPFMDLFNSDTKTIKSDSELKKVFDQAGVDLNKPIVAMCGGGISSCWILVAALLCGAKTVALYDNSWMEWVQVAPDEAKKLGVKGADLK